MLRKVDRRLIARELAQLFYAGRLRARSALLLGGGSRWHGRRARRLELVNPRWDATLRLFRTGFCLMGWRSRGKALKDHFNLLIALSHLPLEKPVGIQTLAQHEEVLRPVI